MAKRARERARQAKQQAKQQKREAGSDGDPDLSAGQEAALMEEFARLSARFEAKTISFDDFTAERARIFTELGIEAG
jgi:hypothetical protein